MDKYSKIYIDGTECDIIEKSGFPISVTKNIETLEDVTNVQGSYIRSNISIKSDSESEKVFQNIGSKDSVDNGALLEKNVVIIANGLPFFRGVASLSEAQLLPDKYSKATNEYSLQVVGENADWFTAMKNLTIGDLDIVPNHSLTDTYIEQQFSNTAANSNICYSTIYLKGFDILDRVQYYEFTLCLFIKAIVREAFRKVGLKLISNFFDTDFGNRLIMPTFWNYTGVEGCEFRGLEFRLPAATPTTTSYYPFLMSTSGNRKDSCKGFTLSAAVTGGFASTYTIKANDAYEVLWTDNILFGHTVPQVKARAMLNGVIITPQSTTQQATFTIYKSVLSLKQSDVLYLEYNAINVVGGVPDELALLVTQQTILKKGNLIANDCLFYNKKHFLSDFIAGITQAFGLVVDTNNSEGTVTVEPRDNYILQGVGALGHYSDLAHKEMTYNRSMKEGATVTFNKKINENVLKSWKSDSADKNIEVLDDKAEISLYSVRAEYNTQNKKQKAVENSFFSKTVMGLNDEIDGKNSFTEVIIPILNKEKGLVILNNQTAFDFEPRILYNAGQRTFQDGEIKVKRDGGTLAAIKTPQCFFYNPKGGDDYSLSYDNQKLLDGTRSIGLFQIFFMQQFARLRFGKILNDKFDFSLIDYLQFRFSQKWRLSNDVFIVQKMENFNFIKNEPTKFVLLADRYATMDDLAQIKNSDLSGYINV